MKLDPPGFQAKIKKSLETKFDDMGQNGSFRSLSTLTSKRQAIKCNFKT